METCGLPVWTTRIPANSLPSSPKARSANFLLLSGKLFYVDLTYAHCVYHARQRIADVLEIPLYCFKVVTSAGHEPNEFDPVGVLLLGQPTVVMIHDKMQLMYETRIAEIGGVATINDLVGAEHLNLGSSGLQALPDRFGELNTLRILYLSSNRLTVLPESIGQLTALKTLCLSTNNLTSLPESIGDLISLEALDIHSNKLTALPKRFTQLAALHHLDVRWNLLAALPQDLGQLSSCTRYTYPTLGETFKQESA